MTHQPRHAITFRQFQTGDHEEVWELHNFGLSHAGAHPGNGDWDEDLNQIPKVYIEAGGDFLVGEYNRCLVACGGILSVDKTTCDFTKMRVDPRCQGIGFGQQLLEAMLARAKELGFSKVKLDSTEVQKPAHALYRKNGFEQVGTIRRYVGFESLLFEKTL